ncbi:MAG: tetratricopeptide repeat protein [Candidatus Aminicenantes bacterium]|nr:tetratricopeptide repeat protein [Candidatus Aminicenantes bacterium]
MDRDRILSQAERLVKKNRFLEAVDEYKTLLTGEEQDVSVKTIIGDLYIKAEKPGLAVEYFKDIADFYEQKGLYSKSIAIHRRINKIVTDDIPAAAKLADLYRERGFLSDAGREYKILADRLLKSGQKKKAVEFLDKLLQINADDNDSRMSLIQIHRELGDKLKAVEELNKAAEWDMRAEELDKAEKCLWQALELVDDHAATLERLVCLYSRQNHLEKAFVLLNKLLDRNENNVAALYSLGDLYFAQKKIEDAERRYLKVAEIRPTDIKIKIKLGKIHLVRGQTEAAFREYEKIVDGLLGKHKMSKAIGILGLILSSDMTHVSTLRKLISIYKMQANTPDYLLAGRVLLSVYTGRGDTHACLSLLQDMLKAAPDEVDLRQRLKTCGEETEIQQEEDAKKSEDAVPDVIEKGLGEAANYVDQGLIRNAERILNRMQRSYPEDRRILDKIEEVRSITSRIQEKEIEAFSEEKKVDIQGQQEDITIPPASVETKRPEQEEALSSRDIFKGTDLFSGEEEQDSVSSYHDLSWIIEEELQSIRSFSSVRNQLSSTIEEKDLGDIVREFRKGMESKFGKDDYESRYTLGIAFLEQELYQEAVEEFKVASGNETMQMDCFNLISLCYRKSGDFRHALEWVLRARDLVPDGSAQDWALKFELAELYEAMNDRDNASKLFKEIHDWNPRYRDVRSKLMSLRKKIDS